MATDAKIVFSATDQTKAAVASFKRGLADIEGSATRLAGVNLGASLGAALTIAGVTAFTRNVINGLDALNDLKDATGASIENISALEDVAARTGTSFDTMSSTLVKFNRVLAEAKPGNEVANTLKKLGLDAQELKRIDPAEALRQTAVALSGWADDGDRARIVSQLFGKSVSEIAPYLKDLSEQGKLVAKVTTEQAQAAEDFNKALFQLEKNAKDVGRTFVGDLVPAINQLFAAIDGGAVGGESPISKWLAVPLQTASVLGANVAFVLKGIGTEIGGIAAQAAAVATLDFSQAASIGQLMRADAKAAREEFDRLEQRLMSIGQVIPQASYSNEGRTKPKPSIGGVPSADKIIKAQKALKEQVFVDTSALDELIQRQRELSTLLENTPTAKLEKQRNLQLDLAAAYEDGRLGIVGSQEALDKYLEAVNTGLPEAIVTAREELETFSNESDEFFRQAASNIQDAFGSTLKQTLKGDFDNIADLWGNLLIDLATQAAAANLSRALFGSEFGGTGQLGGLLGSIFNPGASQYPSTSGPGAGDSSLYVTPGAADGGYLSPAMAGSGRLSIQRATAPTVVINQTNNIGQGVSRGEVEAAVRAGNAQTQESIRRSLSQGRYT